jgi:hypothetical protein
MPTSRRIALLAAGLIAAAAQVSALPADTVGKLLSAHNTTVTSQGLDVRLRPGEDYVVFSGDKIQSGSEDALSQISIPDTGTLAVGAKTTLSLVGAESGYRLTVDHGELSFELRPDAKLVLVAGDREVDLAAGTGKGGLSVTPDGTEGYLVMVDQAGGIQVTYLNTGDVIYSGQATPEMIYAQVGGTDDDDDDAGAFIPGGAGAGAAGAAGAGAGAAGAAGAVGAAAVGGTAIAAAAIPAIAAAVTGTLAVVDSSTNTFRDRDVQPASPVTPGN